MKSFYIIFLAMSLCYITQAQTNKVIDAGNFIEFYFQDSSRIALAKANTRIERPHDNSQKLKVVYDSQNFYLDASKNTIPGITNSWALYQYILDLIASNGANGSSSEPTQLLVLAENIETNDTLKAILRELQKPTSDTTHEAVLSKIEDNTKIECSGLNKKYYINGTNSIILNAGTVCSYSITATRGDITIIENGISSPFNFQSGFSTSTSNFGKILNSSIQITGVSTNSRAVISVIE